MWPILASLWPGPVWQGNSWRETVTGATPSGIGGEPLFSAGPSSQFWRPSLVVLKVCRVYSFDEFGHKCL